MTDIKDQNPQIHLIQPIIQLINQGDIHKAIDAVEGLLIEFSDSSLLFNIRGACYKANDNLEKALESFKKACVLKGATRSALRSARSPWKSNLENLLQNPEHARPGAADLSATRSARPC